MELVTPYTKNYVNKKYVPSGHRRGYSYLLIFLLKGQVTCDELGRTRMKVCVCVCVSEIACDFAEIINDKQR